MDNHKYSDNPRIQTLLMLGKPKVFAIDAWLDYPGKYGFTADDVPALLALHADDSLDALPQERTEVWAPVHAWRILGQLGSAAAITPLVQSFDRLCHDDMALSELPRVLGMLGPAAIPVLVLHWQQADKDQFSHILAMDALYEIASLHPATRTQILDIYQEYMARPNTAARILNGLLLGRLLDLNAIEAIDAMRQLFALRCVDLTCVGDLEEVEIALGLRTERSTPKPNFMKLNNLDVLSSAESDLDLDAEYGMADDSDSGADLDNDFALLDAFLLRYGRDESILGVSELDGYFAALACAPAAIMPSRWMPALWGGEQYMPDWETEDEMKLFTKLIFQHYNSVMDEFQAKDYAPLFLESTVHETELLLVDDWCEGFLRGLALWGALSAQDTAQLEQWLVPIRHFCSDDGYAALASMSDADIIKLQNHIKPAVDSIHQHFFKPVKRADSTFGHVAPKAGRNDPCPCGSGKKHKKCCGLH